MTRLSPAFLCVVALLIAVLTACKARAETTFGCQFVWNNASDQNSVSHCLKNPSFSNQWKMYILPAIACVVFLFSLIFISLLTCARPLLCCSVRNARPKTKEGRERAGCWLYMWIILAIMFCLAVSILIIIGANKLRSSLQDVLDAMDKDATTVFKETRDRISNYVKDKPSVKVDTKKFDNLINDITDQVKKMQSRFPGIFTAAQVIADFAGIMGVLMMMLVLAVACCKCTGVGLGVFTIVYVVFSVLYALLAVGFTIFMYFVIAGCGEITQQYHRAPGIGQWYYVPWCNSKYDFKNMLSELQTEYSSTMINACDDTVKSCDSVNDYSADHPKMYYCTFQTLDECIAASKKGDIYDSDIYIKPIMSNLLVTNTAGWSFMPNVTVSECAERCSDIGDLKAKTLSQSLKTSVVTTAEISTVISYMRPMVDCNYVVDNFLISTQTKDSSGGSWPAEGMTSGCANMTTASILLGVGFLVGAVMFLIGFYVLQRGSFIWIRKTEYDAPSSSSDSDFE